MTKVLIIFGGNSPEHNVSCISAQNIINNINLKLFKVTLCGISKNNIWYTYDDNYSLLDENWITRKVTRLDNIINFLKKFDVVFPITHGNNGEDGKLQGMLDLFNIKYVGSKQLASAIFMDKELSKILFEHLNIKQIPYTTINKDFDLKLPIKQINFPMIVKPANGGSSIGIKKANNKKELKKAIKVASLYDEKIIIEKFIKCRELEVAIIQDNNKLIVSDIGEIVYNNDFYDYKTKYQDSAKIIIPANLDKTVSNEIKKQAALLFKKGGLRNYARIDFFLNDKDLYINEINTIPGFTKSSMFPKLMENKNIKYKDLITKLIKNAT